MFKKIGLALAVTAMTSLSLQAQDDARYSPGTANSSIDAHPGYTGPSNEPFQQPDAMWDIQLDVNATAATSGNVGMAASQLINGEIWTSRWQSDTLYRFDLSGIMLQKFTIPGLTGTRSFATDGTYLYAGTNTSTIYRIDPMTRALAPPHISSGASNTVRHCSYDPTLNAGAGGFWVGNFGTDIEAIGMNGALITSILATTHGLTGMYGSAYDGYTAGGPYLWIFNQGGANTTQIERITIATGMTSANASHDVYADFSASNSLTSGLAGGLFITNGLVVGQNTLGGLIQGTPSNVLFAYELSDLAAAIDDAEAGFSIAPNPTSQNFNIRFTDIGNSDVSVKVLNSVGQVVREMTINPSIQNAVTVDMENEANGIYFVRMEMDGKASTRKLVIAH